MAKLALSALLLAAASASPVTSAQESLPTVDLGYEIHQALAYNDTFDFYTFSNIPFAQPPVGDLRFAAPQPPLNSESKTPNNGSGLRICPQASAGWSGIAVDYYLNYTLLQAAVLTGQVNASAAAQLVTQIPILNDGVVPPFPGYEPQPGESEDCLYLDVLVPKNILLSKKAPSAPVLGKEGSESDLCGV